MAGFNIPDVVTPLLWLLLCVWLGAALLVVGLWIWAPLGFAIAATVLVGGPAVLLAGILAWEAWR